MCFKIVLFAIHCCLLSTMCCSGGGAPLCFEYSEINSDELQDKYISKFECIHLYDPVSSRV